MGQINPKINWWSSVGILSDFCFLSSDIVVHCHDFTCREWTSVYGVRQIWNFGFVATLIEAFVAKMPPPMPDVCFFLHNSYTTHTPFITYNIFLISVYIYFFFKCFLTSAQIVIPGRNRKNNRTKNPIFTNILSPFSLLMFFCSSFFQIWLHYNFSWTIDFVYNFIDTSDSNLYYLSIYLPPANKLYWKRILSAKLHYNWIVGKCLIHSAVWFDIGLFCLIKMMRRRFGVQATFLVYNWERASWIDQFRWIESIHWVYAIRRFVVVVNCTPPSNGSVRCQCIEGRLILIDQWPGYEWRMLISPPLSWIIVKAFTSFLVTLSQSSSISSNETPSKLAPEPCNKSINKNQWKSLGVKLQTEKKNEKQTSVVGMSKAKLSLNTGLSVRFFTWVFFLAMRCPL